MLVALATVALIVLLGLLARFVLAPLLRPPDPGQRERADRRDALDELESRKLSLYREISDAAADNATGKLPAGDFKRIDAELRSEAIEVLKQIDELES